MQYSQSFKVRDGKRVCLRTANAMRLNTGCISPWCDIPQIRCVHRLVCAFAVCKRLSMETPIEWEVGYPFNIPEISSLSVVTVSACHQ
jgi:hypothetical protein